MTVLTSSLGVPTICVSGTCPPVYFPSIAQALSLRPGTFVQVVSERDPNVTKRIVSIVNVENAESTALDMLEKVADAQKTLVFCLTQGVAKMLTQRATERSSIVGHYDKIWTAYSDMDPMARKAFLSDVGAAQSGKNRPQLCFTTSMHAEGVHLDGVDRVIIVGGTHSGLNDVIQMSSRTARGPSQGPSEGANQGPVGGARQGDLDREAPPHTIVLLNKSYFLVKVHGGKGDLHEQS
jgi:superfamily II DNA/RNA helicase